MRRTRWYTTRSRYHFSPRYTRLAKPSLEGPPNSPSRHWSCMAAPTGSPARPGPRTLWRNHPARLSLRSGRIFFMKSIMNRSGWMLRRSLSRGSKMPRRRRQSHKMICPVHTVGDKVNRWITGTRGEKDPDLHRSHLINTNEAGKGSVFNTVCPFMSWLLGILIHHFVGSVDKGHKKGKVLSRIWLLLNGETPVMSGRAPDGACRADL